MSDDLIWRLEGLARYLEREPCADASVRPFQISLCRDAAAALREARTAQIIACMEAESRGHKRGFSDGYKAAAQRAERAEAERDEHIRMNLAADNARYKAEAERDTCRANFTHETRQLAKARSLLPLLASAWFYGGWKAETPNEREMQRIMEQAGWWPVPSEDWLVARIDAALAGEKP